MKGMSRLQRYLELRKRSKRHLAQHLNAGVEAPDGRIASTYSPVSAVMKWAKDEMIREILDIEYPDTGELEIPDYGS